MADTSTIHVSHRQHPNWCDPVACQTYPANHSSPAFVLHAVTVGEPAGCVVELLQREIIDADTGRSVQREPARITVSRDGYDELILPAEKAEELGTAITWATVLSRQDGW